MNRTLPFVLGVVSAFVFFPPVEVTAGVALPGDNYVAGWVKSEQALRFEKSNLFDFIDGGAELFLEFGFDRLLVQRYKRSDGGGGEEISLEIYEMENPEAALGVYLTKCGKETPVEGIKARNSGDRFQFSIVKANYFFQTNNFGGDEKLIPVMVRLSQRVLAGIPSGRPVTLLGRLPKKNYVAGSGRIIRGPYGLQPIFTFGRGDVLELGGKVFGVVGDYVGRRGDVYTRVLIFYPDPQTALSAFENLLNNLDPYLEILDRRGKGFEFKDYQNKYGIVKLKSGTMAILVGLPDHVKGNE